MKLTMPLKRIHFIGIGGIGMSAIAEMLDDLGVAVQGSDARENANTLRLSQKGIPVFIGHEASHVDHADAVVISSAIQPDNPELLAAKQAGLPIAHRSEMLAEILKYKQSICISGTHGKTTTSSLIASVLIEAHKKPSFIIGGILNAHASNARLGKGDYVVVEADESDGSFLRLPTTISVITNIEPEHMDFYQTFDRMKDAYRIFIDHTSFYGFSVACVDHPVVREVVEHIRGRRIISYGLDKKADVHADHIRHQGTCSVFDAFIKQGNKFHKIKDITLSMLGIHNVQNALAAIAVGVELGISDKVIKKALASFKGIQRRLTPRGRIGDVMVYDDYAHHPTEIKASLKALKENTQGRVIAVFQPHRYSRLHDLWDDFLTAFSDAYQVIVTDVYAAGEKPIDGVSGSAFAQVLQLNHPRVVYCPSLEDLPALIDSKMRPLDTVVYLGAGSISAHAVRLVKVLKKRR